MHLPQRFPAAGMIRGLDLAALASESRLVGAAIYLRDLDDDCRAAVVEPGTSIYPASMIKTPLAVAAAVAVQDRRFGWEDRFVIGPAELTANDAPSPLIAGSQASVRELVTLMIGRSDNTATNVLIELLGRSRATADLHALGFPQTAVRRKLSGALPLIEDPAATGRNTHPASEAALLFARIAAGDVPGADLVAAALDEQYWNAKLSTGLASGDRFAHKTGDTDEVSHDGGILRLSSGERYAIVVYTEAPSNDETDRRFGAFMRALRPWLPRERR